MHSKWQIWDFFHSFQKNYLENFQGKLAISGFDPICLKLMKDFLIKGASGRVIHHKLAVDVTRDWIEEEFQTLSLFGSSDSFVIHQAQDLKADILENLISLELTDRFILLSFESESTSAWKKVIKDNSFTIQQVESPRFWEFNKLLDFVTSYLKLPLSYESKAWILDSIENNLTDFYHAAIILKLNYPQAQEIKLEQVESLLKKDKLDQFALASMFVRKKFSDFYERLVVFEGEFDKSRSFFFFMQGHLVKLMDTSYLNGKPRLSNYDKELQMTSKLWKPEELELEIKRFNDWEILSKKKDQFLWSHIRRQLLLSQQG